MSDTSGQSDSSPGPEALRSWRRFSTSSLVLRVSATCIWTDRELLCNGCGRVYPIVDGIPVLIVERSNSLQESPERAEAHQRTLTRIALQSPTCTGFPR